MTGNDDSNVFVLKDESKRRQKQAPAKPKAKRGRPPAIDDDVAFRLVSEVKEEKQKVGLLKEAITNLIEDDAPHSWWWDKNAPLGFPAADRRYHRAVERLESYEKKHGVAYEPMSLANLEKAWITPPERPARTIKQLIEETLDRKRELYESRGMMSPSQYLDFKRDCRRSERRFVKVLKEYARSIGKKIATDGPKHPAEKVKRAREHLKELDELIADFESKLTKIEGEGH